MKIVLKAKAVLFFLFVCVLTNAIAQNASFNTQYLFNLLQINPAYSGTSERIEIVGGTKLQWFGGLEGTPITHYLSANTLIGSSNVGIGTSFNHESIGPIKNTSLLLDVSYHVQLNKEQYLSLGMKAGGAFFALNLNEVDALDLGDEFLQGNKNQLLGVIGLGAFYYSESVYLGASAPSFFTSKLSIIDTSQSSFQQSQPNYLIAGTIIQLNNRDWKTRPSVLYRIEDNLPNILDINNQFIYKDKYWFGLGYKSSKDLVLITQVKHNDFKFGYSFNYPISGASKLSNFQTHELLISYSFLKKSSIYVSPRFF